jgi:phosphonopyruvate decarboxylase
VIIATTGYTGRELFALEDRPNQLYMVGSMGCASSLGLGLSLARPDLQVIVVDGDGAALMRMGNLATIGTYGGPNLIHILLDNEAHDSTGAQATVSCNFSFAQVANACGYSLALAGNELELLDELLAASNREGPRFAQIKIRTGTARELPRPQLTPPETKERLMAHLARIT